MLGPAVIDDTTKEIVYRDYVDVSVAVATPKVLTFDPLLQSSTNSLTSVDLNTVSLCAGARRTSRPQR